MRGEAGLAAPAGPRLRATQPGDCTLTPLPDPPGPLEGGLVAPLASRARRPPASGQVRAPDIDRSGTARPQDDDPNGASEADQLDRNSAETAGVIRRVTARPVHLLPATL